MVGRAYVLAALATVALTLSAGGAAAVEGGYETPTPLPTTGRTDFPSEPPTIAPTEQTEPNIQEVPPVVPPQEPPAATTSTPTLAATGTGVAVALALAAVLVGAGMLIGSFAKARRPL